MCVHDQERDAVSPTPYQRHVAFPWHLGAFDVHNHIAERMLSVSSLTNMKARAVCIMATRTQDQGLVADIVATHGLKGPDCLERETTTVVAGYGRHPWFSHELYDDSEPVPTYVPADDVETAKEKHYRAVLTPSPEDPAFWRDLPTPIPLSSFIADTKARLQADALAMIGEVGLDKAFRLPMQWEAATKASQDPARTPGARQRRPLSQHRIQMSHQKVVLIAHLRLAGELGRAVSIHGVQAHGVLYDFLTSCWKGHEIKSQRSLKKQSKETAATVESTQQTGKPFPPRICLHSFSGRSDAVKQYLKPSIPAKIFFSFSKTNNLASLAAKEKAADALKLVPDDRVLVESDLHTAGDAMDADIEEMYRTICEIKGWELEAGVRRIAANYREFVFG